MIPLPKLLSVFCLSLSLSMFPSSCLSSHLSQHFPHHSSQAHSQDAMSHFQDHTITGPHSRHSNQPAKKYHDEFDLSSISGRPGQDQNRNQFYFRVDLKMLKQLWARLVTMSIESSQSKSSQIHWATRGMISSQTLRRVCLE
jgi:hypothetical protein